jgi:hypothetical protein
MKWGSEDIRSEEGSKDVRSEEGSEDVRSEEGSEDVRSEEGSEREEEMEVILTLSWLGQHTDGRLLEAFRQAGCIQLRESGRQRKSERMGRCGLGEEALWRKQSREERELKRIQKRCK